MTWVKLDEHFRHHPKAIRVGPLGRDLFVCGLEYCNENLTDGFIPDDMVTHLSPGQSRPSRIVKLLLDNGLWTRGDEGYHVHDYLKYQPSAIQVLAEREAARVRKERWLERRRNGVPHGVDHGVSTPERTAEERAPRPVPVPSRPVTTETTLLSTDEASARRRDASELRSRAHAVLTWLNQKAGRNFPLNETNTALVIARLKDGVKDWQLKAIVSIKAEQWKPDEKMAAFLRPKTLFGRTNVSNYLGELPAGPEVRA